MNRSPRPRSPQASARPRLRRASWARQSGSHPSVTRVSREAGTLDPARDRWCRTSLPMAATSATRESKARGLGRGGLVHGWQALGSGSFLAGVATDVRTGAVPITQPRWPPRPEGRLPLRQELHKLGSAASSLLVRTKGSRLGGGAPGIARHAPFSSHPAATRVSTPVAATPGERQPRALASHHESGCEQAPRRVRQLRKAGPPARRSRRRAADGRGMRTFGEHGGGAAIGRRTCFAVYSELTARNRSAVSARVSIPMGSARSSIVKLGWWCGKALLLPAPTKKKQPGAARR